VRDPATRSERHDAHRALVTTPVACVALALEPLGAIAGTTSGILGFVSMAGASLLSGFVNARITDTVTSTSVAYVVFGSLALVSMLLAGAGQATGPSTRSR